MRHKRYTHKGSVLSIVLFTIAFFLLFTLPIEQMRQVCLGSHVQSLRDPAKGHGRFLPQEPGDSDLLSTPLWPLRELSAGPAKLFEFGVNSVSGLLFTRLANLLPVMFRPGVHLCQQFFAKFLTADTPTPLFFLKGITEACRSSKSFI